MNLSGQLPIIYIENNTYRYAEIPDYFISSAERDISRVSAANESDMVFNTRSKSGVPKHTYAIFSVFYNIYQRNHAILQI